jgi:hypothetical protein
MSSDISPKKLAIFFLIGGVALVFAILGFSVQNLFLNNIVEEARGTMKQGGSCIVEGSDGVPREISSCPYDVGDIISITYKPAQPTIVEHRPIKGTNEN